MPTASALVPALSLQYTLSLRILKIRVKTLKQVEKLVIQNKLSINDEFLDESFPGGNILRDSFHAHLMSFGDTMY